MPQFIMEGTDSAQRELDPFVFGYIEALFFTSCSPAWDKDDIESDLAAWEHAEREGQSGGTIPGDAGFLDLAPDSLARIKADCAAFEAANEALLDFATESPDYGRAQAGRDYWFTRNGHGVGYWDRGDLERTRPGASETVGDELSAASRYSDVSVWWSPVDSLVHVE